MALYSEEDYERYNEDFKKAFVEAEWRQPIDNEYLSTKFGELYTDIGDSFTLDNMYGSTTKQLDNRALDSIQRYQKAQSLNQRDESNTSKELSEIYTTEPDQTELWGTNAMEINLANPKINNEARRYYTYRYAKLSSPDKAIFDSIERYNHRFDATIPADEANRYLKENGYEITFDKPVSKFEIEQSVAIHDQRKEYEYKLAQLNTTGSQGVINDVMVLGAGLAGGVGPIEATTSLVAGVWAPNMAVGTIARGASVTKQLLNIKKAQNVSRAIKRAKTINVANKGNFMPEGSPANNVSKVLVKDANKAKKLEQENIKLMASLEKLEGLNYNGLTALEKTGLDALTMGAVDAQFPQIAYNNSEEMGLNIYTEKDLLADTLVGFGLGTFVPGGLRFIGGKLGIMPHELMIRRLDNMETDIKAKVALGELDEEIGNRALEVTRKIRKNEEEIQKTMKGVHPFLQEMSADIRRTNVSDETVLAWYQIMERELYAGNRPKITMFPQFESIMSHIDSNVLRRLYKEKIDSVFPEGAITRLPNGTVHSVKITGETGLLGQARVTALSDEEALEQLENLYKGQILRDQNNLEGDNEFLTKFRQWTGKFSDFTSEMVPLLAKILDDMDVNLKTADKNKRVKSVVEVGHLRDAFYRYKLSAEDFETYTALMRSNVDSVKNIRGYNIDAALTPELLDTERAFKDFLHEYFEVSEGKVRDFLNPKDVHKIKDIKKSKINDLISDLSQGAKDNEFLLNANDYTTSWSSEKVAAYLKKGFNLDVSVDTDINRLFGADRCTREELDEVVLDDVAWEAQATIKRFEHNKKLTNKIKDLVDSMRSNSNPDPNSVSRFTENLKLLEDITKVKSEGFESIKQNIIKQLQESPAFQRRIESSMKGESVEKGLDSIIRTVVSKALANTPVKAVVGNTHTAVNHVVRSFMKEFKEHPEKLQAFLVPEKVAEKEKIPNFGDPKQRMEVAAKANQATATLLDSLDKGLKIELNRIELQAMHDVDVAIDKMSLMLAHPEVAAEILTGSATQTHSVFAGSKRNVEYLTRSSGLYINDIKNQLKQLESQTIKGQTLLEYCYNPSNKDDIQEAIIRRRRGLQGLANADADRVAKIILDQEASLLSQYRKYGSAHNSSASIVDRSKTQYADVAISEDEIKELQTNLDKNLASLETLSEGGEALQSLATVVANVLVNLNKVYNPGYRKMSFWAFRDFDLDAMFDPDGTSFIPMNSVRDAMLHGNWEDLIAGDPENIKDIMTTAKRIESSILGANYEVKEEGILPTGWVFMYSTGFSDTSAVVTGKKIAGLDAVQTGIQFKDVESELYAAKLFGHDSVEQYLVRSFEGTAHSLYVLEQFGTRPQEMAKDLVRTYNSMLHSKPELIKTFANLMESRGEKPERLFEKFGISEGALQSIEENIKLNCGLQNAAPSAATRVVKALSTMLSSSMLVGSGLRSLSDYGTIWSGLIQNAMVDRGLAEAMSLTGEALTMFVKHGKLLNDFLSCSILQEEDLLKKVLNDPSIDIKSLSAMSGSVDKMEEMATKMANFFMNNVGHMTDVTNWNKRQAAYAIQRAMGDKASISYKDLPENLQIALLKENITAEDWDFLRVHAVQDIVQAINARLPEGAKKIKGDPNLVLDPLILNNLPDSVFKKELKKRGKENITPAAVAELKNLMISKAYNLVDTSADEMVSIPSNRIINTLRGGKARNSFMGAVLDLVTKFSSFGTALLFNNYGKYLANIAYKETGISIIDLLNPRVKLNRAKRGGIYAGLFGIVMQLAIPMMVVDTLTRASTGNIQKPIDEKGDLHLDNLTSSFLGAFGIAGTFMDAIITGIEGSGQRGGGFSMQVAPPLANALRIAYRLRKPIVSDKVENKPEALAAASTQELARFMGLRSTPFVALVYQNWIGAYLESIAAGGLNDYDTVQKARKRRGQVLMPWEKNPEPFWEKIDEAFNQ